MKKYNLFVLLNNISKEEVDRANQEIFDLFKKLGIEIEKKSDFGKRKLSYIIKTIRHGYYIDYLITLPEENVAERLNQIRDNLKLNQDILRFQISTHKEVNFVQSKKQEKKLDNDKNEDEKEYLKQDVKQDKINLEDLNQKLDNILENKNI